MQNVVSTFFPFLNCHATKGYMPDREALHLLPVIKSKNAPVPMVTLTSPSFRHCDPKKNKIIIFKL